jgi:hypothetical protein
MTIVKAANRLVLSILLAAATCAAHAEQIADGIAWTKSSEDMHVAYIRAISDVLSASYQYDEKHFPGQQDTFSHKAVQGLGDTTVIEAVKGVNAWYKAHPDQLTTPVLKVIWTAMAKPNLTKSK